MEKIEASIRAKVEHLFRVVKRQLVTLGALSGLEEEHAAAQDAVCAVQPVDGAPSIAGSSGMVRLKTGEGPSKRCRWPESV